MTRRRIEQISSPYLEYLFLEISFCLLAYWAKNQCLYFSRDSKLALIISHRMGNGIPTLSFRAITQVTLGLPLIRLLGYVLERVLANMGLILGYRHHRRLSYRRSSIRVRH